MNVGCLRGFLSKRTYEEGGSGRGVHYRMSAEVNILAETTACRRLSHGERNIRPRKRRWFCRGKVFAHTRWGLMWVFGFVPGAPFFFVERDSFLCCIASARLHWALKCLRFVRVEKWKRCAEINNK